MGKGETAKERIIKETLKRGKEEFRDRSGYNFFVKKEVRSTVKGK